MHIYVTNFGSRTIRITLHSKSHAIIEAFEGDTLIKMKKYEVGDQVEYQKISTSRFGPIINITEKNIIIQTKESGVKHMRPDAFGWHNWDFDVSIAAAKNAHEMMFY